MKVTDEVLDAMIRAGLVTAFGGSSEEVSKIVSTVQDCDEAQVILRKQGKAVGVLLIADETQANPADVRARGQEVLSTLQ